eukprot:9665938-Heterocapsa_arctica.AAC.1
MNGGLSILIWGDTVGWYGANTSNNCLAYDWWAQQANILLRHNWAQLETLPRPSDSTCGAPLLPTV